jgi:hypothetical protein
MDRPVLREGTFYLKSAFLFSWLLKMGRLTTSAKARILRCVLSFIVATDW